MSALPLDFPVKVNRNLHDYPLTQHTLAIHEAGHIVASQAFGCGFEHAIINPAALEGSVWIRNVTGVPGKMTMDDLTFEQKIAYAIIKYAGMAAEGRFMDTGMPDPTSLHNHGGVTDFEHAAYAISACSALDGLRSNPMLVAIDIMTITWCWLGEPPIWTLVQRVAGALCDHTGAMVTEKFPGLENVPKSIDKACAKIKELARIREEQLRHGPAKEPFDWLPHGDKGMGPPLPESIRRLATLRDSLPPALLRELGVI